MTTEADNFLADVTVERWQPHVGSWFAIYWDGAGQEDLQLIEAKAFFREAPTDTRVPFSLLFRAASRDFPIPQGIYLLTHPAFPAMELFLVPVGPDSSGICFQVIFS